MGITRQTIKDQKLRPDQVSYAKYVLDGYMANDSWSIKSQKKVQLF